MLSDESPFPGMDPWLESYWGDVHGSLVSFTRNDLNRRLVPGLVARLQERVYIESPLMERRGLIPDVHVLEERFQRPLAETGLAVAPAPAEPDLLEVGAIEVTERFIEIRDARTDDLVITVIEFVSSTNKKTRVGRRKYLQKQREVQWSKSTNLVEVDLLRAGKPVTLAIPAIIPRHRRAPYHVAVHRALRSEKVEYYPIQLQHRLPVIKIPLRPNDADVAFDLQAALSDVYRGGRYSRTINYAEPPDPPLKGDDAEWAAEIIQKRNA